MAAVARRYRPELSLGWYIAAATALDLLWPIFLLLGIEHVGIVPGATAFTPFVLDSYPWSHSLVMVIVWAAALGGLARWRSGSTRAAAVVAALVVSHWVLDLVMHVPDLPLWPGDSPHFGLGLWNSVVGTLVIEGAIWVGGLTLYLRSRRSTSWVGAAAFWSFVLLATVSWTMGLWAPPPSEAEMAWFALVGWLVVPWTAFADARMLRSETGVTPVSVRAKAPAR